MRFRWFAFILLGFSMLYLSIFGLSGNPFAITPGQTTVTLIVETYNGAGWAPQGNVKISSYNLSSDMVTELGLIEVVYSDASGMHIFGNSTFGYSAGHYEFKAEWPAGSGITNSTKIGVGDEPFTAPALHVGIGPGAPFDFWQWLTAALNEALVKNGLMYGGVGFIGVGAALFMMPHKISKGKKRT